MRTTINIHDGLLKTVKARAQEQGKTLGDVIEEALQRYLAIVDGPMEAGPPLPVFRGGTGLRPGIDLSANAGLYDAMYAEEDDETAAMIRGDELP